MRYYTQQKHIFGCRDVQKGFFFHHIEQFYEIMQLYAHTIFTSLVIILKDSSPLPDTRKIHQLTAFCARAISIADSSASEEAVPRQTRRGTKRPAEVEEKSTTTMLKELLTDITNHREAWPFLTPVTTAEVPDYHEYIKNPMDFETIMNKLEGGKYATTQQFMSDCQLVFDNCHTYNKEHSSVYK